MLNERGNDLGDVLQSCFTAMETSLNGGYLYARGMQNLSPRESL